MKKSQLVVFYGPRKIGKTSLLVRVAAHFKALGHEVQGVLSPAIFENGEKTGIRLQSLATGEERMLATRRQSEDPLDATPGYDFNAENLLWGDSILQASVPTEVLIVDELGPLEIKFGKGWQQGVAAVTSGAYDLCIVVLREELHSMVADRWQVSDWVEYSPSLNESWFDRYLD